MPLKLIALADRRRCAGRKSVVYLGAVDREWATLTSFVTYHIEKLVKQGLLVAKKAYSTHDNTGILSPSENQTGHFTQCFFIWLVKGPDLCFYPALVLTATWKNLPLLAFYSIWGGIYNPDGMFYLLHIRYWTQSCPA